MFRRFKAIAGSAAIAALAAVAACGGSNQPATQKPAPDAKKVDPATAGAISGKVLIDGKLPDNPVINMVSDPACVAANTGHEVRGESYVADNGGLENVFVYIKDGLGNKYVFDQPMQPVKLDQKGCHYIPHVLGVRVAQPLEIVNDDSTLHNVHGMPETNQEFNYGQAVQGQSNTVTFTAPEVLIPFKCDVHVWMNAYVGVVDNPYFAVTADGGTFSLTQIPPGTYTVEAVHEKLGRSSQTVTLGPKESKDITFTFKAS
ncbi:MAG TPA: carboxypeptidase regulatory-like domain-containing protein [Vicinamibacterales bacterium]|jgi:plastocyanin